MYNFILVSVILHFIVEVKLIWLVVSSNNKFDGGGGDDSGNDTCELWINLILLLLTSLLLPRWFLSVDISYNSGVGIYGWWCDGDILSDPVAVHF